MEQAVLVVLEAAEQVVLEIEMYLKMVLLAQLTRAVEAALVQGLALLALAD